MSLLLSLVFIVLLLLIYGVSNIPDRPTREDSRPEKPTKLPPPPPNNLPTVDVDSEMPKVEPPRSEATKHACLAAEKIAKEPNKYGSHICTTTVSDKAERYVCNTDLRGIENLNGEAVVPVETKDNPNVGDIAYCFGLYGPIAIGQVVSTCTSGTHVYILPTDSWGVRGIADPQIQYASPEYFQKLKAKYE